MNNSQELDRQLAKLGFTEREIGWMYSTLESRGFDISKTKFIGREVSKKDEKWAIRKWMRKSFRFSFAMMRGDLRGDILDNALDWVVLWQYLVSIYGFVAIKMQVPGKTGDRYTIFAGPNPKCRNPKLDRIEEAREENVYDEFSYLPGECRLGSREELESE